LFTLAVIGVGNFDDKVLREICMGLKEIIQLRKCSVSASSISIQESYNSSRRQYHSTKLLTALEQFAKGTDADKVLGVTDVDLYVPTLNFVFGEAQCPGRVALISTHRLHPEYYGEVNPELYRKRVLKEAVHELGHTLGLGHCVNQACVMFFSNSIIDTDRKDYRLCANCLREI